MRQIACNATFAGMGHLNGCRYVLESIRFRGTPGIECSPCGMLASFCAAARSPKICAGKKTSAAWGTTALS